MQDLQPQDWLSIVQREYLQRFIRQGGSSVKFVVTNAESVTEEIQDRLAAMAKAEDFCTVHVDARQTKVHMTDRLFHQIARLIDWDDLSYRFVSALLTENGYQLPKDRNQFSLSHIATLNERAEPLLRRDFNTWLERAIFHDPSMCQEFRMAMIRLCLAQLDQGDTSSFLTNAVKEWLKGELRQISVLKEALIFQKIVRHNARHMLASLAHWLRLVGKSGLVLTLDLARYFVNKRPEQPEGFYYSASATMDTYETLRQFIDATDEMEGTLFVVLTPPEFMSDGRRGLNRYEALKLRIWDEVRDQNRQNPLGALIRLSGPSEYGQGAVTENKLGSPLVEKGDTTHQRVIEALRSGVPNRDVVHALGSTQPDIEGGFRRLLSQNEQSITNGLMAKGLLISGGFGTGKSHLMTALQHIALEQNFICSHVVISKETPLYNLTTMYRGAIEAAVVPQKRGNALTEIAGELNFQSPQYSDFFEKVHHNGKEIDSRFAATLYLYEHMVNDPELSHRMIRFWAGDPIHNGVLKKYLEACSPTVPYELNKISSHDLALQRFKFAARLIVAAGYKGWILFIDEAEIMGRYSFKQRSKSYGELARWLGALEASQFPGIAAVFALTDDFQSVVVDEKGDREKVSASQAGADSESTRTIANQAEKGLQLIDHEPISLSAPYDRLIEETYQKIRSIHGSAYGWDPPEVSSVEQLSSTRMREYVRGWITEWDLKRLAPCEDVNIQIMELEQKYNEDMVLETPLEEDIQPEGDSIREEAVCSIASESH